jgi:hypothetical protein
MESKITKVEIQKIDIQLNKQERANFLALLNEIDTIYHTSSDYCTDHSIIANLRSAMIEFKKRYDIKK